MPDKKNEPLRDKDREGSIPSTESSVPDFEHTPPPPDSDDGNSNKE